MELRPRHQILGAGRRRTSVPHTPAQENGQLHRFLLENMLGQELVADQVFGQAGQGLPGVQGLVSLASLYLEESSSRNTIRQKNRISIATSGTCRGSTVTALNGNISKTTET